MFYSKSPIPRLIPKPNDVLGAWLLVVRGGENDGKPILFDGEKIGYPQNLAAFFSSQPNAQRHIERYQMQGVETEWWSLTQINEYFKPRGITQCLMDATPPPDNKPDSKTA